MQKLNFLRGVKFIIFLNCFFVLLGATAWARSGMRIVSGPEQVTVSNPPCDEERITTFSITIGNTNPVFNCSEDVDPVREATSNPAVPALGEVRVEVRPPDALEFLGFKMTENDDPSPSLSFNDIAAQEEITFFFDVKTGPVQGILIERPFEFAEFGIAICDSGGPCDWGFWADPADPICEDPTKFTPTIRLEADSSFCAPPEEGDAVIEGQVTTGVLNRPVRGAAIRATNQTNGFTYETQTGLILDQRGRYELTGLPVGQYEMEAIAGVGCALATIDISNENDTLTQDFFLSADMCQ